MSNSFDSLRGAAPVALVAAAALLALTGCQARTGAETSGVSGSGTSSGATSTLGSEVATPATAVPIVALPVVPTAQQSQSAAASPPATHSVPAAPPSPTPTPCPLPEQRFVHIVSLGVDSATGLDRIVAQPATALCGGGLPDDSQYTATGAAADYDVSTAVKITGMSLGGQPYSESWSQFAAGNLGTYGGFYGIDLGKSGLVTVIDQYFHP